MILFVAVVCGVHAAFNRVPLLRLLRKARVIVVPVLTLALPQDLGYYLLNCLQRHLFTGDRPRLLRAIVLQLLVEKLPT